jgi:hypothetical protein
MWAWGVVKVGVLGVGDWDWEMEEGEREETSVSVSRNWRNRVVRLCGSWQTFLAQGS